MFQSQAVRDAIAAIGADMGDDAIQRSVALFLAEQRGLAETDPAPVADIAYGPDPRHRLDVYSRSAGPAPVLVFVHGGGFTRGDKQPPGSPYNAHVGRTAARHGLVGVVMNYRLAPDHLWPTGGDDIGAAVAWAKAHAADHGGDPDRIFLMGTSAGAAHIATYLQRSGGVRDVRGAILLSGIYKLAEGQPANVYYGEDDSRRAEQSSLDGLAATDTALFVACAEFDPPRFQHQTVALLQKRLEAKGRLPAAYVASGHNHFSMAMHLGGSDERLLREILDFIAYQSA